MKLTYFYLPNCPHCRLANSLIEELQAAEPRYRDIEFVRVDESRDAALAASYDYWYVPCFFMDGKKLHEGHAEREDIRRVLEAAAKGN